jgi:glycosyltransferase involved in cell wall biosynthesis
MTPYRVLHLIPRVAVAPPRIPIGGSAVSLLSLIEAQQHLDDHRIGLLTGVKQADVSPSSVLGSGVEVATVPMRGPPVSRRYGAEFTARSVSRASFWEEALEPNIVHGHSGRWHYSLTTRLLARRLDCAWIHTLYCPIPGGASRAETWLMRRTLSRAAAVTGMSQNVVSSLARVGMPAHRLHHVDPCIDLERWQPTGDSRLTREKIGIPSDRQIVLFVGNAHPSKGFDILWNAIEALRGRGHNPYLIATFELRGHSHAGRMAEQLGRGRDADVRILGIVEDMPQLLGAADVLVVPFRSTDGPSDYPLPMLEAMAVGTPVIAADVGGVSEVIKDGETGLLIPPESPSHLASAIEELLTGRTSGDDLVHAARTLVQERFSPSVAARNWKRLYEENLVNDR